MKSWKLIYLIAISVIILAGCNNDGGNAKTAGKSANGITIGIATTWPDWMLEERVSNPIAEIYPDITIEYLPVHSQEDLEELIANNNTPDLFHRVGHRILENLDLLYDLEDLIAESDTLNLEEVDQTIIETIRAQDEKERLWGLPYQGKMYGLFYNKHVFDKFGVDYPTDEMTWKETVDLAKQVSGERDGAEYRGIAIESPGFLINQFAINFTDPETAEVLIADEPAFIRTAELIQDIMNIPGLATRDDEDQNTFFSRVGFEEGTTAMVATWGAGYEWYHDSDVMNFDGVTMPVWDDMPGVDPMSIETGPFAISAYSEHKEEAFKIIEFLLSDEHQKWGATKGITPALENPSQEIVDAFGADLDDVEGKNIAGLFINTSASPPKKLSQWDRHVHVDAAFREFIDNDQDVNTFLRVLKEESEINIKNEQESN